MTDKETGGPAFPAEVFDESKPEGDQLTIYSGMTLRDYFAAKAMQGYIATEAGIHVTESMLAECAYRVAEAMLKARGA